MRYKAKPCRNCGSFGGPLGEVYIEKNVITYRCSRCRSPYHIPDTELKTRVKPDPLDIDVLAAFVKVLAEHKPASGLTDDWLRGYDDAQESIAQLARQTLAAASITIEKKESNPNEPF